MTLKLNHIIVDTEKVKMESDSMHIRVPRMDKSKGMDRFIIYPRF